METRIFSGKNFQKTSTFGQVFICKRNYQFFLEENLTGQLLSSSLEYQVDENDGMELSEYNLYFHRYRAPAHYDVTVRMWCNEQFLGT